MVIAAARDSKSTLLAEHHLGFSSICATGFYREESISENSFFSLSLSGSVILLLSFCEAMVEGPGVHRVALVHRRMLQGRVSKEFVTQLSLPLCVCPSCAHDS
jgi:hypothetical protein